MLHPSYLLFFPLDLPAIPFSPPSVRQTFTARLAGGEYERNSSKERGGGDDGVEGGQRSGRQKFGMRANRRKEGKEEKHFPFRHHPPPLSLHPFLSFLALNMLGSQDERCRHWGFFSCRMFTTIEQTRVLYRNKWDPKNRRFVPHVQQACKEGEGRLPPSCSSFLNSNLEFVAAFNVHAWKHKAERKKVGRKGRKTAGLRNRKRLATFFGRDRSANKKVLPLSPEQTNEGLLARTVPQRWKEGFHSKRPRLA